MKRLVSVILAALVCLGLAVTASAVSDSHKIDGVEFKISSEYNLLTAEDMPASTKVEGLVFAAMTSDGEHQIQCRRTVTDFSEQLGSFKGIVAEALAPVGQKLFPDGYTTAEFASGIYLKQTSESDGDYSVLYVTVADGKLYTFTYFGSDPTRIAEFMGTVTLADSSENQGHDIIMIVLLSVGIAVFIILAAVLIFSFVKDYRRRKMEQSENIVSNYIKIKRRKY